MVKGKENVHLYSATLPHNYAASVPLLSQRGLPHSLYCVQSSHSRTLACSQTATRSTTL